MSNRYSLITHHISWKFNEVLKKVFWLYIIYSYDLPSRKCVVTFYIKVCKWSLKKIDFVGIELSIQDMFGCAYFVMHFPPLYILKWVYILIASSNTEHLKNQFCNLSSYFRKILQLLHSISSLFYAKDYWYFIWWFDAPVGNGTDHFSTKSDF